jgi:hypothetical protein
MASQPGEVKKFLFFLIPTLTGLLFAFLYLSERREIEKLEARNTITIEQLQTENHSLAGRVRDLQAAVEDCRNNPANPLDLQSWDIERMKREGLRDPVHDIVADLRMHRELIPFEGTLGGRMGFYSEKKIWILTNQWVLAYFDDGHMIGYMLLEYSLPGDGKIHWKRLAAYLD